MVKIYISFAGRCSEALECYARAFRSDIRNLVRYCDLPDGDDTDHHVLHSEMDIEGATFIFSDYLEPMTMGDNYSILLEVDSDEKVIAYYDGLREGAEITIELGPLDLPGVMCSLYVNFRDRFGVNWVIMCKSSS